MPIDHHPRPRTHTALLMVLLCLGTMACNDDGGDGTSADINRDTGLDTLDDTTDTTPQEDSRSESDTRLEDTEPTPSAQEQLLAIEETGSVELPGLEAEVQVVYTEMGIPHIYAQSRRDLGYALGFVLARDRFFVMDLQRRLALGTLSAVLGDIALSNDIEARLMGMAEVTDRIMDNLSEVDAAYMDAYADGVNAYIAQVADGALPAPSELETAGPLLGSTNPVDLMQPFDRRSVAAMVAVIVYETNFESGDPGRELKADGLEELFPDAPFAELRQAGARKDIWDRLVPLFDVVSAPGFGIYNAGQQADRKPLRPYPLPEPNPQTLHNLRWTLPRPMLARTTERLDAIRIRFGRRELDNFGSNTWAVQGTRTRDGASLVAGDGHLPLSVPSLMYQIGMDTRVFGDGDIAEAGLLITSLPVLAVGTNGSIAWSQVNPVSDIVDWYREVVVLDSEGVPTASMFQGEERPLIAIEEAYTIANVPALGSEGRTETWTRWTTFDGRHLFDIEGLEIGPDDPIEPGQRPTRFGDRIIIPQDTDGDGLITAISFDYTAFDLTRYVGTLVDFTRDQASGRFLVVEHGLTSG
ncbi:MAG: penicillin acylase family protein, partial [Myxococcota bacterium]